MAARTLKTMTSLDVRGLGGLLAGLSMRLEQGDTLVVGRSRTCDVSLRKTSAFKARSDAEELLASPQFNRVSRIHCEIEYRKDGQVQIRDLSRNGTLVDGVRVGRSHLVRVGGGEIAIELVDATWGRLILAASPDGEDAPPVA